jgi:hypothetical protein
MGSSGRCSDHEASLSKEITTDVIDRISFLQELVGIK